MSDQPADPAPCAWSRALAALEDEVEAAASLLAAEQHTDAEQTAVAWQPPALAGPVPAHLRRRAEELVARQQAVAQQVAHTLTALRPQLAVARKVDQSVTRPVYLDLHA